MRRILALLSVALLWPTTVSAESTLRAKIDALASPPTVAQLTELAATSPNAYVYFLQSFLKDRGAFDGSINGQLNAATIRSLLGYCRSVQIAETCSKGPLEPEVVATTSTSIVEAITTVASTVADAPEKADAILPPGWRISNVDGLGVSVDLLAAGASSATFHVAGTASTNSYINIYIGPKVSADGTEWKTAISAAQQSAAGSSSVPVRLRTAMRDAKDYAGELFQGVPVPFGDVPQQLSASGVPKADVIGMEPYVQIRLKQGDTVDLTLRLADPSFTKAE